MFFNFRLIQTLKLLLKSLYLNSVQSAVEPRYIGFTAPDAFVVGYGFDHRQRFRNLPDIHLLER